MLAGAYELPEGALLCSALWAAHMVLMLHIPTYTPIVGKQYHALCVSSEYNAMCVQVYTYCMYTFRCPK